ncbi:FG-GAP repeat domain-containing protein [Streptomyces fradiae]|uniref:FG-GAP repeat domain-containing protein n=1 Tax=Streptomyces fradiae TaxID=1906 RepID=UPI0035BE8724
MSRLVGYGDLSGDGRADLLTVERSTGRLCLYTGTAAGTLGARTLIGNGGWNAMNALVGVGDLNGDGRAGLYAREAATGKLWLYPGRHGSLGPRALVGGGGWNAMDSLVANGDRSADGRPDLLATDGHWLFRYRGLSTGGVAAAEKTSATWWSLNGVF